MVNGNRPQVSIIIPLYRRTGWIGKCLAALSCQNFDGIFEVIVIDDGSPNKEEIEGLVNEARQFLGERLSFARKGNGGPAAARNFGARFASGELLCFLDDDSVPDPNWLREIVRSFGESGAGLVCGRTVAYQRKAALPLLLERTVYSGKCWATNNIAYRRDVFESLNGFDEAFPEPSWEDNDLGLRARWAGFRHEYNPQALIFHPHEETIDEYRLKCRLNGRGAAAFSRKYLFRKPLWGLATPFLMSRRLVYGILPSVWRGGLTEQYVQFLWSLFSLQGFWGACWSNKAYGKNQKG